MNMPLTAPVDISWQASPHTSPFYYDHSELGSVTGSGSSGIPEHGYADLGAGS
jgi:hypothetical protein